jgi:FtsP/CotA-like multicopper oxidase with cupredoxin domain
MGPAERADMIVDFTGVPAGRYVLGNAGPDEPFGGGLPDEDFDAADAATTGQVMEFRVVPVVGVDESTPPQFLQLPAITPLPAETVTRPLALLEEMSAFFEDAPAAALLGTADGGELVKRMWADEISENPEVGATEVWELYNGKVTQAEPWEAGFKDTVVAYPGQVTRVRARFATPGQFVWHCHIVEHEDNEMMRPYRIGPTQSGQPE